MALAGILPTFEADKPPAPSFTAIFGAATGRAGEIAEAEERGFQKGIETARAEAEATFKDASAFADSRVQEERVRWLEEEASRLTEGWDGALRALEARLADTVAGLLLPLIGAALAAKATSELSAAIMGLLAQDRQPLIRVVGPADLIEALRTRLGDSVPCVEFAAAESADVSLAAGDTFIETQLQPWRERLSQAIASNV
jgi:hypothetical protein